MDKKSKIILIVSIVSMLIVVSVASYAYLKTYSTQTDVNQITALDCLNVSITNKSDTINLQNAYPISDTEGQSLEPYTFKIKNECSEPVYANVNIESLVVDNALDISYVKVSIDKGSAALVSSKSNGTKILANTVSSSSKNLTNAVLASGEEREYDLRLWVTSGATTDQMGKTYKGKIVVVANTLDYIPIDQPDWNAQEGTLLYALKNGKYIYSEPITEPGKAVSNESEGIISSAPDDYGTSYYFRGNIDDNYVVFANMCWRIVRITGSDGEAGEYNNAIKLILFNYNPDNLTNPCIQNGDDLAFARYSGSSYSTAFGLSHTYNAYIGYMYGTPNSSTYNAEHENKTDSLILTRLKTWYDAKLRDYNDDYLADTIWCNDKRITSGTGIKKVNTTYASNSRKTNPLLTCGENEEDNKISKFTASDVKYGNGKLHGTNGTGDPEYKIGLLTADEVSFAGTYLNLNTTAYWWTLSPSSYRSGNTALMYGVNTGPTLLDTTGITNTTSGRKIRPSISLQSTVEINEGSDGTAKNPYIIQESVGE